jgi:Transposase IS116/IS110/IS902 family
MAPAVDAYQAMLGFSFIVAVTFVAEIGDVRRFDNPRQLMAFLGLVPTERRPGRGFDVPVSNLAGKRARRLRIDLELPLSGPRRRDSANPAGGAAESGSRYRLESPHPPVRAVSPAQRRRQEDARGHRRDRP